MRVLSLLLLAVLVACGGDSSTEPDGPLSIGGTWNFSDQITASSVGVSCSSAGTGTLTQSGSTFTGSVNVTVGICSDGLGNQVDNTGLSQVTGGQVNGNQVSFQMPFCQFTGTISGSPANQMGGTETCTIAVSGQQVTFTGSWQASR
ncbi:MAG TPA: hypothetical protein VJU15_12275 [Gemmatimonadales bacterium]|nr:hypothetical protein [Gemmatimonadales bacterium]